MVITSHASQGTSSSNGLHKGQAERSQLGAASKWGCGWIVGRAGEGRTSLKVTGFRFIILNELNGVSGGVRDLTLPHL